MEDSNRTRRRIITFVISKGGKLTGGHHDNFVAWLFYRLHDGKYSHERVGYLKNTLLAMEIDGEIRLEHSDERRKRRITGISLPDDVIIESIDIESRDGFDTESVWLLVGRLMQQNAVLREEVEEASRMRAEYVSADTYQEAPLQMRAPSFNHTSSASPSCNHDREIADLKAAHADQMLRQREEANRLRSALQAEFANYRKKASRDKSKLGGEVAELKRENAELRANFGLPDRVVEQLRALSRAPGIDFQNFSLAI